MAAAASAASSFRFSSTSVAAFHVVMASSERALSPADAWNMLTPSSEFSQRIHVIISSVMMLPARIPISVAGEP